MHVTSLSLGCFAPSLAVACAWCDLDATRFMHRLGLMGL